MELINKTMDRDDLDRPEARRVVEELNELAGLLADHGLKASTWYGFLDLPESRDYELANRGYRYAPLAGAADDRCWPWFLSWEIAWLALNLDLRPGQRVLDLGGSSSLFSYYLASKGLTVVTVDRNAGLVENANEVAARLGWPLTNHVMDMRRLSLTERFDHATSVCVYEHVPVSGRIEVSESVAGLLVDGGTFSLTFDYRNPRARLASPADIEDQIVRPSGLAVRGNREFHDNGKRYLLHPFFHPRAFSAGWKRDGVRSGEFRLLDYPRVRLSNHYTFGALFLRKDGPTRSGPPGR